MAMIITPLSLDVSRKNRIQAIVAKQYDRDSRFLKIQLTDGGKPITVAPALVVTINAHRADNEEKSFVGEVNNDGTVTVPITYWMLELDDTVSCDISVEDAEGAKLSSLNFIIEVEHANYSGTEISEDDPQYDVFIQVLANENVRVAAEQTRAANEQARIAAETARKEAETQRINDEQTRIANEQARVTAEAQRKSKFDTWETAIGSLASYDSRITRNSKRITNLEQGIPSELFETDSTAAYVKDVPVNALPYAEVTKIGGMTRKCTNLIPFPYASGDNLETNGVTFTVNSDGSVTVNGTPTAKTYFRLIDYTTDTLPVGTYTCGKGEKVVFLAEAYNGSTWVKTLAQNNTTFTVDWNGYNTIRAMLYLFTGTTVSNLTVYPMLNEGSTALPYEPYFEGLRDAKVTEIKSVGVNLIPYPYIHQSGHVTNGITFKVTSDGAVKISGTSTAVAYFNLCKINFGDTWFSSRYGSSGTNTLYTLSGSTDGLVISYSADSGLTYIAVDAGVTIDTTIYPMCNEGTTVLPYTPYFRNSLPIPEAVQAIEGFGWGINADCYNYIDWDKKQFVKRVGRVDLGTLDWGEYNDSVFWAVLNDGAYTGSAISAAVLCAEYHKIGDAVHNDKTMAFGNNFLGNRRSPIVIHDNTYPDAATFKAAMSGVMLVYELAEPEVTDISDLLSADNFLAVEGGGTITAVNEYGYDVPSEITYMLKETTV